MVARLEINLGCSAALKALDSEGESADVNLGRSGAFAREWLAENRNGRPNFERMRQADRHHEIEQVGAQLRAMMPWSEEGKAAQRAATEPKEPAARKAATVS